MRDAVCLSFSRYAKPFLLTFDETSLSVPFIWFQILGGVWHNNFMPAWKQKALGFNLGVETTREKSINQNDIEVLQLNPFQQKAPE